MSRIVISHASRRGRFMADTVSTHLIAGGHDVGVLTPYLDYVEGLARRPRPAFQRPSYDHTAVTSPEFIAEQRRRSLVGARGQMLLVLDDPVMRESARDIAIAAALRDGPASGGPLYTEICTLQPPNSDPLLAETFRYFGVIGLADSQILPGIDALLEQTPTALRYQGAMRAAAAGAEALK